MSMDRASAPYPRLERFTSRQNSQTGEGRGSDSPAEAPHPTPAAFAQGDQLTAGEVRGETQVSQPTAHATLTTSDVLTGRQTPENAEQGSAGGDMPPLVGQQSPERGVGTGT
eukprot:3977937-Pyramimonas_sp.AAC.1